MVRYIAPSYDYIFTASEKAIPMYRETGCENVYFLPFACEPTIHRKLSQEGQEKYESDVVFVETYTPKRARLIKALEKAQIKEEPRGAEAMISIVIPTYNSENTIEACLKSVKMQTYASIEVIVVDKFSTDKTPEIARNYGVRVIQGYFNKPEARNVGILNSDGEYIFLADSDFIFEPRLLEEVVKCFREKGCDAIFVSEQYAGNDFLRRCRNLEKKMYQGVEEIESPRVLRNGCSVRCSLMRKMKGQTSMIFILTPKDSA